MKFQLNRLIINIENFLLDPNLFTKDHIDVQCVK